MVTIDLSAGALTSTSPFSGAVNDIGGLAGDAVSYTNWLTGQVAAMQGSEVITVISAPDWYAPELPRPMADVGWTFEQLTDPTGDTLKFTLPSWSSFFGYIASLPFQLIKTLWQLVAYFGPLGLFLGWLFIMFVIVLIIHAQVIIIRFVVTIIRLIVRLVELLGEWVPTGG